MKHSIKVILFTVLAIIAVVLVDSMTNNIDVSKRAVIVGFGIDTEQENFIVTADIFTPSQGASTNGNSYTTITSEGRTLQEAMSGVGGKLGLVASYKHAQTILVGESILAEKQLYDCLEYLFESDAMPDSSLVVACKGKAEEIISATTVMSDSSVMMINQALDNTKQLNLINSKLSGYFTDLLSESKTYALPVVSLNKVEHKPDENNSQDKTYYSIDYSKSVAVNKDSYLFLDEKQTLGLSYFNHSINSGNISFIDKDGNKKSFAVFNGKASAEVSGEDNKTKIKVKLSMRNALNPSTNRGDVYNFITEDDKVYITEDIKDNILNCYEECKKQGFDILHLRESYYATTGKKDFAFLEKTQLDIEVKLEMK